MSRRRSRLLAIVVATFTFGGTASSASAWDIWAAYAGGCWPGEYEGVTRWDGGSSSTGGAVTGTLYQGINGNWQWYKQSTDSNSGVGPRRARVALHGHRNTPLYLSTSHAATFFSGVLWRSAVTNSICA